MLRLSRRSLLVPTVLVAAACLLASQTGADEGEDEPSPLSLRTAISRSLEKNLGLQIQRIDPAIASEEVTQEEAAFDPSLFGSANLSQSELEWTDEDDEFRQTTSDSRNYAAGVLKRVRTGGQVTFSVNNSRSVGSSFNPDLNQLVGGGLSERASIELQVNQPLLQDFGTEVSRAPVRRAESQLRVAGLETRNAVFDLLQETEVAYWRLADTYTRRELREINLRLAEQLLEESSERQRIGIATRLEVLQAEANLAQQRQEIIRSDQAIREAADALLATMGELSEDLSMDTGLQVNELRDVAIDLPPFESSLDNAFARNFDTAIQEELLDQLEQDRILARNRKRPEMDLALSGSYDGLSRIGGGDALSEALDRKGDEWRIGLNFTLPWGERSAKAQLAQVLYRIDQAELRLAELKQDLLRSVRSAWRDLSASLEQVSASSLVVELQEATFEQERAKFEEGLSTFRDILEAQRDRDAAILSLLDAQLAAVEAEIRLARVQGTVLERHDLTWEEVDIDTR